MIQLSARLVIVTLVLLLSACGFHLRGDIKLDAAFSPMVIVPGELTPSQQQQIRKALNRASTIVVDEATDAHRLEVTAPKTSVRNVARSNLNDVTLVQLTMTMQYHLLDRAGKDITGWRELSETSEIERDDANLLVQQKQLDAARAQLFDKLVQRMISGLKG